MVNAPQIEVTVLVRATWTPDLTDDGEYPTIEDYRNQVRHQFTVDPMGALQKLPEPRVVRASVDTQERSAVPASDFTGRLATGSQ